jgi:hypothetical protein
MYPTSRKEGAVRRDCVSEILYLLRLRYLLGERVYYHPTRIAASTMVARAIQESSINNREELLDVRGSLGGFGDDELIRKMATSRNKVARGSAALSGIDGCPVLRLAGFTRGLPTACRRQFADPASRRTWENETARALGGEDGQVLV